MKVSPAAQGEGLASCIDKSMRRQIELLYYFSRERRYRSFESSRHDSAVSDPSVLRTRRDGWLDACSSQVRIGRWAVCAHIFVPEDEKYR